MQSVQLISARRLAIAGSDQPGLVQAGRSPESNGSDFSDFGNDETIGPGSTSTGIPAVADGFRASGSSNLSGGVSASAVPSSDAGNLPGRRPPWVEGIPLLASQAASLAPLGGEEYSATASRHAAAEPG